MIIGECAIQWTHCELCPGQKSIYYLSLYDLTITRGHDILQVSRYHLISDLCPTVLKMFRYFSLF